MAFEKNVFPQSGDANDASRFAQLAGHDILVDYIESGINVSADFTNDSATVSEGVCYISKESEVATSDSNEIRNLGFAIQVESKTFSLSVSGTQYVYVNPRLFTTDFPEIEVFTDETNTPVPGLKVAEVDVDNQTVSHYNQNPSATVETITVTDSIDLQGSGSGVATLDPDGNLETTQVPDLAITQVYTVADEAARLALSDVEEGDVAIQNDNDKSYIFTGGDPSTNADWETIGGGLDAQDVINAVDNKTTNTQINGSAFSFDSTVGSTESYTIGNDGSVVLAGPFEVDGTVKIEGNGRLKVI